MSHPTPADIVSALYEELAAYESEHGPMPIGFRTIVRKGIARANAEHRAEQEAAQAARLAETVSLVRGVM